MWSFTPFRIPTYSNLHTRTSYNTTFIRNSAMMAMLRFVQTCVQVVYCTVCTRLHLCNYIYMPLRF